ncbi:MAG: tRNA pseudouridine(55) synthase TruB [Eubacteriales bacterium]|nr:tRNA pseudouridine(55) synthase TruB [Eubacteriales bacterium]
MKDGIVVIDKGEGVTSQRVVSSVKRIFSCKKAGHSGTLDPMATGVLPVMLGRATKACEFIMDSKKHYVAVMRLCITTDTEDITGKTLSVSDKIPTQEEVIACADGFVGEIMQTPPMYSALKVDGRKLVDLAREGKEIDREARKITVYSLLCQRINDTDYSLDVVCSKGTYIRTLCADIGKALGCGAAMATLRRVESGGFDISQAYSLEKLSDMSKEELDKIIIPVDKVFEKYVKVILPDFFSRLARNGLEIYQKKIGTDIPMGEMVAMYDRHGFFAVGEVREFDDGSAVKPIRLFCGEVAEYGTGSAVKPIRQDAEYGTGSAVKPIRQDAEYGTSSDSEKSKQEVSPK